jgi:hypothetical protein
MRCRAVSVEPTEEPRHFNRIAALNSFLKKFSALFSAAQKFIADNKQLTGLLL